MLNDASEIKILALIPTRPRRTPPWAASADTLTLELPVQKPDVAVPVIELFPQILTPSPGPAR